MTSGCGVRHSGCPRILASVAAILLATIAVGCGRPSGSSADPTPTHIPQPTPDPRMVEVIRGHGSPVIYLPPLEIQGSPTPARAAGRPTAAPSNNRSVPKPTAPVRETAPAPKPAAPARETAPAPKPAPRPTSSTPSNRSGGSGAAPAIINPNTILPGGAGRPKPTPGR